MICYLSVTAILHNFFVARNPPSSWIEEDNQNDQILGALHYLSPNMTRREGKHGNGHREVLN
jgi:hypothetical protein